MLACLPYGRMTANSRAFLVIPSVFDLADAHPRVNMLKNVPVVKHSLNLNRTLSCVVNRLSSTRRLHLQTRRG